MRSFHCQRWYGNSATISTRSKLPSKRNERVKPFEKILVANRGEIACRVMKTARKMGIKTVAIYSEADTHSLHVEMADEAICVGPPPTNSSYLNIPAILNAIKKTGAQAVHPGYGFLSENFRFCQALDEAGIVFIGPSVEAMAQMGDKIQSKIVAHRARVHTIPGHDGVVADEEQAMDIARKIGYPVMIKASAGGGGKGMRIAWNDDDIQKNFRIAAMESQASFGDDRLLIEKYIEEPRHVEVQILGDQYGNVIYLPERECSIQRRNQKVIEEAPSPAIDPSTRQQMGQQAVSLAHQVGYYSAGTVEFLVDRDRKFYFLEMNTRLQVEHPITEYITGIDLVEQMIRVAAGESLTIRQQDVQINGWALESRVYAEDPKLFLPSIGNLKKYIEPTEREHDQGTTCDDGHNNGYNTGNNDQNVFNTTMTITNHPTIKNPFIRCDSGIREGSEISIYYDPLICKLCTHGPDRLTAINRMKQALDSYVIRGVTHNIPLIRQVISQDRFQAGKLSTKYLMEEFPNGFTGHQLTAKERRQLARAAVFIYDRQNLKLGWKSVQTREPLWVQFDDNEELMVSADRNQVDDQTIHFVPDEWKTSFPLLSATFDQNEPPLILQYHGSAYLGELRLQAFGSVYSVKIRTTLEKHLSPFLPVAHTTTSERLIKAPMAGQVVNVMVEEGQTVQEGGELLIIEAMKMQNVLRAPKAAKVTKVLIEKSKNVAADQLLLELEFVK